MTGGPGTLPVRDVVHPIQEHVLDCDPVLREFSGGA